MCATSYTEDLEESADMQKIFRMFRRSVQDIGTLMEDIKILRYRLEAEMETMKTLIKEQNAEMKNITTLKMEVFEKTDSTVQPTYPRTLKTVRA